MAEKKCVHMWLGGRDDGPSLEMLVRDDIKLSRTEYRLLFWILVRFTDNECGIPINQTEVAMEFGLSRQSLNTSVRRLEKLGIISYVGMKEHTRFYMLNPSMCSTGSVDAGTYQDMQTKQKGAKPCPIS